MNNINSTHCLLPKMWCYFPLLERNIVDTCCGLNCVPPEKYVEVLTPGTYRCT